MSKVWRDGGRRPRHIEPVGDLNVIENFRTWIESPPAIDPEHYGNSLNPCGRRVPKKPTSDRAFGSQRKMWD